MFFVDIIVPLLTFATLFYLVYRTLKKEIARQEKNQQDLLNSIDGIAYMISEHTATLKHMCADLEEETIVDNDNYTK